MNLNVSFESIKEAIKQRTPAHRHQLVDDVFVVAEEFRRGKVRGARALAGMIHKKLHK